MGEILRKLGFLSSDSLSLALANQFGAEHIDLDHLEPNPEYATMVPETMARRLNVLPFSRTGAELLLAMGNIYDIEAISEVEALTRLRVKVRGAGSS